MAAYTTRAEIEAMIPPTEMERALDDDGNETEDTGLYDQLAALADQEVDALIAPAVTGPVSPAPSLLRYAARVFLARSLYERSGVDADKNPYTAAADRSRESLEAIGKGEAVLSGSAAQVSFTSSVLIFDQGAT